MKPRSIFYGIMIALVIFLVAFFIFQRNKPDDPLDDPAAQSMILQPAAALARPV
ncbi:hypothetical protein [Rhizobium halophytocola]|uniref:Uncharacterized protein n=1 Tax=Rhizobium halophytocola TaxID=735519 RepID=A0ABS4E2B9_9HYPH|nr:hypothetical protein [Rhizobium halophytocola]MBP1852078.1 hypothetical protein [Rhizobium halophytocola]